MLYWIYWLTTPKGFNRHMFAMYMYSIRHIVVNGRSIQDIHDAIYIATDMYIQ